MASRERTVHKYSMDDATMRVTLPMRTSSKIVLIAHQGALIPVIWVEHVRSEMSEKEQPYTIETHGTGYTIPDDGRAWVGSVVCGRLVWHLYGWWGDSPVPKSAYADPPVR